MIKIGFILLNILIFIALMNLDMVGIIAISVNSFFYLTSVILVKIASPQNWRSESVLTMKYLGIKNPFFQILSFISMGIVLSITDFIFYFKKTL